MAKSTYLKLPAKYHPYVFTPMMGFALFCLALLTRFLNLDHGLYVDELYHLLAARSFVSDGSLSIADGDYTRVALYTQFLGLLFHIFGEGEYVARLSSAITGSVFVVIFYLSVSRMVGRHVGAVAALCICFMPTMIYLSQFIRFYAFHQLAFWIGTASFFFLVTTSCGRAGSVMLFCLTAFFFSAAYYCQVTTLIGLAMILAWSALYWTYQNWARVGVARNYIVAGALLTTIVGFYLLLSADLGGDLWGSFRQVAPWAAEAQFNVLYYHRFFGYQYPTFWTLFPVAAAVAIYEKPTTAFFCVWIFSTSIFFHSFAGMKDERYIAYLLPFFVVVWSIAAVSVVPAIYRLIREIVSKCKKVNFSEKVISRLSIFAVACACGFVLSSNSAVPMTFAMLAGQQYRHESGDWSLAASQVQPLVDTADVILTTNDVQSLYYFGNVDFVFSEFLYEEAQWHLVADRQTGIVRDWRTGLSVINELTLFELIIRCSQNGVFLGDTDKWRKEKIGLGMDGVRFLEENTVRIEIPSNVGLTVFVWRNKEITHDSLDCVSMKKNIL